MASEITLKLQEQLRAFARERDWDQFHSPKNLTMALIVEAAELVEHFQWLTEFESKEIGHSEDIKNAVAEEIADVYLYLLRLADILQIDIERAAMKKIELNAKKYPVGLSKGNAKKYTSLE